MSHAPARARRRWPSCSFAAPAAAQSGVDKAASALKSDPVYVDPSAELADQVDADALQARIKSAGAAPLFIAVLPQSAQVNSAGRTLVALRQAVGRKGTYALARRQRVPDARRRLQRRRGGRTAPAARTRDDLAGDADRVHRRRRQGAEGRRRGRQLRSAR